MIAILVSAVLFHSPANPQQRHFDEASFLLRQPSGTVVNWPSKEAEFTALNVALVRMAVAMEVLDSREGAYTFNQTIESVASADLDRIRERVFDLADSPSVATIESWPDREVFIQRCHFNRRYLAHIEGLWRAEPDRKHLYEEVIGEINWLYQVNDLMRDARSEYFYVYVRRRAAKRAIQMAGDQIFDCPAAPIWRMNELK